MSLIGNGFELLPKQRSKRRSVGPPIENANKLWETLGQTLSNETRDFTYSIMAISILKGTFTGRTKNDFCGCQISHVPCPKSINIQKKLEVPPSLRIRVTFNFISHDNNSVALPLKYFKFWSKIDL